MPEFIEHTTLDLGLLQYQPAPATPATHSVLGVPVCDSTVARTIDLLNHWIDTSTRARLVTFTNVHMVVEAQLHPGFQSLLNITDLNCPDGAPIYWMVKSQRAAAEKISGPDFMPLFCEQSVARGHRHFLYGGAEGVAAEAVEALRARFPGINIVGHFSPPFRELTHPEAESVVAQINNSGADVVWVSLGCPRQEIWMAEFAPRLHAKVVLAVGQAVDILAGRRSRCPTLMSRLGLEWAYRLTKDPTRLWKRYLVTNSLFVLMVARSRLAQRAPHKI